MLRETYKTTYSLTWGHYTELMHARLESEMTFKAIKAASDLIGLLKLIKGSYSLSMDRSTSTM